METKKTTISVYEALERRKLYLKRLDKLSSKINSTYPGVVAMYNKANHSEEEIEAEKASCQSNYDTVVSLLHNIGVIDAAISDYNASAKVKIGDAEYTIACAISLEKRIDNEIKFYSMCLAYYDKLAADISAKNERNLSPDAVAAYIEKTMKDCPKGTDAVEYAAKLTEKYKTDNIYLMLDPANVSKKAKKALEDAELFKARFHQEIIHSNYTTNLELNLIE